MATTTNKVEWTKEITTSLIELYEGHPCLYDSKHKFYSNKHARNDALLKISHELQNLEATIQVEDVKKKITNLRQQFAHEKSKVIVQHSGMDADNIYEPTVWWYDKLLFLTPFVKTRKTCSTLDLMTESNSETMVETDNVVDDSCSTGSEQQETPRSVAKKRKVSAQEQEPDPILNETMSTLKMLGSKLKPKSDWQVYSEYISNELQNIEDEELINEAKQLINNILYETHKKQVAMKKAKETIQQVHVITLPFDEDTVQQVASVTDSLKN